MDDSTRGPLGPGDLAPTFELPAADAEGTVALADYLRRGPVLLTMLRGLYCAFCRRHISQLRPTCEMLRPSGIALLGIVVASPKRARQYFAHFPPCFPIAAAPDRAVHRAYGLPEVVRTAEFLQETERRAVVTAYFGNEGAWRLEARAAAVFAVLGVLGGRAPLVLVLGYVLHGPWDLLHELHAHAGLDVGTSTVTEIPLAYGRAEHRPAQDERTPPCSSW